MAIPLVSDVLSLAKSQLGDDSGQLFTNTVLLPHYQSAFRELWRVMASVGIPRVLRVGFYTLPAHTSYFDPATAGITDLSEPEWLYERDGGTSVSITGITAATSPTVTAAGHPFATGNYAVISGPITGLSGATGQFAVTVTSSSQFTLNGAITTGAWSAGGTASLATTDWSDVGPPVSSITAQTTEAGNINQWAWLEGKIQLTPCSSARQLRIMYWSSGAAPTTTSDPVGIDDSLDFLAARTAGLAAESRGAIDRGKTLNAYAIGMNLKPDGSDGLLNQFLVSHVRGMQRQRWIRPPYGRHPNKDYLVFPA